MKTGFRFTKRNLFWVLAFVAIVLLTFGGLMLMRFINYKKAGKLLDEGKYEQAYDAFKDLNGFLESEEKLAEAKKEMLRNAKAGSRVYFGYYFTGDESDDRKDDDIAWTVLEVDGDTALLISEKVIDHYYWVRNYYDLSYDEIPNWKDSLLRKYLNNTFYTTAFNEEEKQRIVDSEVKIGDEEIGDYFRDKVESVTSEDVCVDKVYVLSFSEAMKYFPTDEKRKSECTFFAKDQAYHLELHLTYPRNAWEADSRSWWLRSVLESEDGVRGMSYVGESGQIKMQMESTRGIRPVIHVSIK